MAAKFTPVGLDTSEWFSSITPGFFSSIPLPEPTQTHFYVASRALSYFPVVNERGACYMPGDLTDDIAKTFIGKLANLKHDKGEIVGTVCQSALTDLGCDVIIEIDREAADAQGLTLEDLKQGMVFSQCSVEVQRDLSKCRYLVLGENSEVLRTVPVLLGHQAGMKRTAGTGYRYQNKYEVAEAIVPEYFSGIALVPNPADPTAQLYAAAADNKGLDDTLNMNPYSALLDCNEDGSTKEPYGPHASYADPGFQKDEKKRYPLDTAEHTRAAASYFGMTKNREKYTPEQRARIERTIARAESNHGIYHPEQAAAPEAPASTIQEKASMTDVEIKALQDEIVALKAEIASAKAKEVASEEVSAKYATLQTEHEAMKTELASVTTERDAVKTENETFKAEKASAERTSRVEALVSELVALHPAEGDALAALKETASTVIDDATKIHTLKLERELFALKAKVAESASAPGTVTTPVTKEIANNGIPPVPSFDVTSGGLNTKQRTELFAKL